jgi:hypothetical protein
MVYLSLTSVHTKAGWKSLWFDVLTIASVQLMVALRDVVWQNISSRTLALIYQNTQCPAQK